MHRPLAQTLPQCCYSLPACLFCHHQDTFQPSLGLLSIVPAWPSCMHLLADPTVHAYPHCKRVGLQNACGCGSRRGMKRSGKIWGRGASSTRQSARQCDTAVGNRVSKGGGRAGGRWLRTLCEWKQGSRKEVHKKMQMLGSHHNHGTGRTHTRDIRRAPRPGGGRRGSCCRAHSSDSMRWCTIRKYSGSFGSVLAVRYPSLQAAGRGGHSLRLGQAGTHDPWPHAAQRCAALRCTTHRLHRRGPS